MNKGDKYMKTVYTCFCTDVIHEGHINIIEQAHKYGRVVIGALTDEALIRYNRFPTISFEERVKLYRELDGVDDVIIQNTIMYDDVINSLKPDYVVHGDNWQEGTESVIGKMLSLFCLNMVVSLLRYHILIMKKLKK